MTSLLLFIIYVTAILGACASMVRVILKTKVFSKVTLDKQYDKLLKQLSTGAKISFLVFALVLFLFGTFDSDYLALDSLQHIILFAMYLSYFLAGVIFILLLIVTILFSAKDKEAPGVLGKSILSSTIYGFCMMLLSWLIDA